MAYKGRSVIVEIDSYLAASDLCSNPSKITRNSNANLQRRYPFATRRIYAVSLHSFDLVITNEGQVNI